MESPFGFQEGADQPPESPEITWQTQAALSCRVIPVIMWRFADESKEKNELNGPEGLDPRLWNSAPWWDCRADFHDGSDSVKLLRTQTPWWKELTSGNSASQLSRQHEI